MGSPVLLVDLGGVLFEFDHPHRLNVLGDCLGLPPTHIHALLWQSGFSADCDAGRYPDAGAVRAEIRHMTGYDDSADNVEAARRCGWTAVEYHSPADMAELLTPR